MNGNDADPGEAPYQCSLQKSSKHFCGCAIIKTEQPNWIITAAHCLLGYLIELGFEKEKNQCQKWNIDILRERARDVEVLVGTNKLSAGGTRYSTNKTFIHEKYIKSNYAYDIALLRVQTPIEFNPKVQPIKISPKVINPGTQLKVL